MQAAIRKTRLIVIPSVLLLIVALLVLPIWLSTPGPMVAGAVGMSSGVMADLIVIMVIIPTLALDYAALEATLSGLEDGKPLMIRVAAACLAILSGLAMAEIYFYALIAFS